MREVEVSVADPADEAVRRLLDDHIAFARDHTSAEHVHALPPEAVAVAKDLTLFGARLNGRLVAIGGLRQLDVTHGELKSVHTAQASRGRGVGHAVVEHLLDVAHSRDYRAVFLETGTGDAFAASRALYRSVGFELCAPFADHVEGPESVFMAYDLLQEPRREPRSSRSLRGRGPVHTIHQSARWGRRHSPSGRTSRRDPHAAPPLPKFRRKS